MQPTLRRRSFRISHPPARKPWPRLCTALLAATFAVALPSQSAWMYDAVAHDSESGRYYFFFGTHYVLKEHDQPIDGLIRNTQTDWHLPASWGGGDIDAAVYVPDNSCYYFFKGGEYAKKPRGKACEAPKSTQEVWGTPPHWQGRIDAAVYKTSTNTYYFFHDDEYTEKAHGQPMGPAMPIADWGLPAGQPILGALYTSRGEDRYYFFYGTGYVRKDRGKDAGELGEYRGNFRWRARPKDAWVGVACEAGYALHYQVDWTNGHGKKKSKSGSRTLGVSTRIKLPRDAQSVRVRGWAVNPFGDDPKVFDEKWSAPPNTYMIATGTLTELGHRKGGWKSPLDDIEQGLEDAWEAVSDLASDALDAVESELMIGRAQEALQQNAGLIGELVTAATAAAQDVHTYETLAQQLGQAVSGGGRDIAGSAKNAIKGIFESPHFAKLKASAQHVPFRNLSVGLNVGAAKFIGAGMSVGGSFSTRDASVSLAVSGGASLSADVGPSGGVSFGVERPGGSSAYVSAGVPGPAGTEIEVVFSVPDLQLQGFAVTISPPGKKAVKKVLEGSLSAGYSYEIF